MRGDSNTTLEKRTDNVTFYCPQAKMNHELMNKVLKVVSHLAQHSCVIKHCSWVFIQWAGNMTHAMSIYRIYFADQFVLFFFQIAFAVVLSARPRSVLPSYLSRCTVSSPCLSPSPESIMWIRLH